MQHPLRQARPSDPFLRLRVADDHVRHFAVDEDHVAFLRTGRTSGETWITALGEEPTRVTALIESLRHHGFDGVTVHDHVFDHLPADLRGPAPGHWSLWEFDGRMMEASGSTRLDPHDPRIDPLLAHSDSAYIHAGDPRVVQWHGIEDGDRLVAVGAWTSSVGGAAHLVSICTDPAYRGRGIGTALTVGLTRGALTEGATGVNLEMYADNLPAAAVYRAAGFAECGRYCSAMIRTSRAVEGSHGREPA